MDLLSARGNSLVGVVPRQVSKPLEVEEYLKEQKITKITPIRAYVPKWRGPFGFDISIQTLIISKGKSVHT